MNFTLYAMPIITVIIFATGFFKKCDVFDDFTQGAYENFKSALDILPSLIALMTAVGVLRASGLLDFITEIAAPVTDLIGFPSECLPLALIRPISGSGALAVYENILSENSPESFAVKTASILFGSTETTFYTIAVYFGAVRISKTRHTLFCALIGDFTGFIISSILARFML